MDCPQAMKKKSKLGCSSSAMAPTSSNGDSYIKQQLQVKKKKSTRERARERRRARIVALL